AVPGGWTQRARSAERVLPRAGNESETVHGRRTASAGAPRVMQRAGGIGHGDRRRHQLRLLRGGAVRRQLPPGLPRKAFGNAAETGGTMTATRLSFPLPLSSIPFPHHPDALALVRPVIEHIPQGVLIFGDGAEVLLANTLAETIFGYAAGQMIGVPIGRLFLDSLAG